MTRVYTPMFIADLTLVLKTKKMFKTRAKLKPNKRSEAGFFSRLTYFYLNDFFALGRKRPIEFTDCWEPAENDCGLNQIDKIEREWQKELVNEEPSLGWAIYRANYWRIWLWSILMTLGFLTRVVMPFAVSELLKWFTFEQQNNNAYIYVGILFAVAYFHGFLMPQVWEYQAWACPLSQTKIRLPLKWLFSN